jgi:hypothetical protein
MGSEAGDVRAGVVRGTCLAVAVVAVFGAMNSYQTSVRNARQYPDAYGAGRAQVRFAPLVARVPASARLGYLTDLDRSSDAYAAGFLAAQYALAPRQLVASEAPEWAVGNFSQPQDFAAAGAALGYELSADLGNGVALYRRKGR